MCWAVVGRSMALAGRDEVFDSVVRRMDCLEGEEDKEVDVVCFGRDISGRPRYMVKGR